MEITPEELKNLMHTVVDDMRLEVRKSIRRALVTVFGVFILVAFVLPFIFPQLDFCRVSEEMRSYQIIYETP